MKMSYYSSWGREKNREVGVDLIWVESFQMYAISICIIPQIQVFLPNHRSWKDERTNKGKVFLIWVSPTIDFEPNQAPSLGEAGFITNPFNFFTPRIILHGTYMCRSYSRALSRRQSRREGPGKKNSSRGRMDWGTNNVGVPYEIAHECKRRFGGARERNPNEAMYKRTDRI